MGNPHRPHPELPLSGVGLSTRILNGLKRARIDTIGDLQLLTEHELRKIPVIGKKGTKEVNALLGMRDCRLRDPEEPLHLRARKVFEGAGTACISVAHFREILGDERIDALSGQRAKSAGPLARLSRAEIDRKCRRSSPLTDEEAAKLREALRRLGLEPHV